MSLSLHPTRQPPREFGPFRIVRLLGEGGMGAVYLADDTRLGYPVALKVPHFRREENPKLIERFQREARLAKSLHHPFVCPVYDVGEIDGIHYLTMPFVEGTPLSRLVSPDNPWDPRAAVELTRKLARALDALHRGQVLHRDLKPHNILVRPDGAPMIMDFGLARALGEEEKRLTSTGQAVGSPAYMAPEMVEGNAALLGPATDVYSLGVILYELLTGRLPFTGATLASLFYQILSVPPAPPSQVRAGLDAGLEAVCLKALAKKPPDRHASMADFAAELERLSGGIAEPVRVEENPAPALPGDDVATEPEEPPTLWDRPPPDQTPLDGPDGLTLPLPPPREEPFPQTLVLPPADLPGLTPPARPEETPPAPPAPEPELEEEEDPDEEVPAETSRTTSGMVIGALGGALAGGVVGWLFAGLAGGLIGGVAGWLVGAVAGAVGGRLTDRKKEPAAVLAFREGLAQNQKGQYARALAAYRRAIGHDPGHALTYNNLAWLLATCPDLAIRDGPQAVQYATRACELTSWGKAVLLDTLAAAHAECGQFAEAVRRQREALEANPPRNKRRAYLLRLELYQARQWASSADEATRDGRRAVEYARRCCEWTDWEDASCLDALAAAHAECGQFAEAVRHAEKAVELAEEGRKAEYRARLDLYRSGRPYRVG